MTETYIYRPPLKYLFAGLGGILISTLFGMAIGEDSIWFSLLMAFFCLMGLAMGVGFLTLFFHKFKVKNLKIGNDYIEIPGRWKDHTRLSFDEIIGISKFDTYDQVIEIESKEGIHLIEKNWMRKKDFYKVEAKLKEYWYNV